MGQFSITKLEQISLLTLSLYDYALEGKRIIDVEDE